MAAAPRKVGVQPTPCRAAASGNEAAMAPTWPSCPVSWVMSGLCRVPNHRAATRITLTKIIASPAPTSTRARTPSSKVPTTEKSSWPPVIRASPVRIIRLDPNRSSSTPTGTCRAAYTSSWSTVNVASWVPEMWNRSAASSPATPRDVRWKTART